MLLACVFLLLSSNAVSFRRDKTILCARSIIAGLIICLLLNMSNMDFNFLDKGIGLYHGLFQANAITHIFHIFIFVVSGLILQLNSFYPRKLWTDRLSSFRSILLYKLVYFNSFISNKMAEQFRILEYPLIVLFVIIGGTFLMTSSDLMSIFIAIELQSYGLYLLCSIYRDSEKATSAALMYFLLGGLSSCFILLASSLLYSNSGNTGFDGLYIINSISETANHTETFKDGFIDIYKSYYINSSLVIMSIGFLFKVTAAPFHFWSPDVYDAIPTIVTTFVAIFAKISIFILLMELVYFTNNLFVLDSFNTVTNYSWTFTLLISSLFSLIIGSILGLTQFRIKRLYAYSTISHVGFILLALSINTIESIQSFMFYLLQYSISNLNAFILLITIGYSLYLFIEKNNYNHFDSLKQDKLAEEKYEKQTQDEEIEQTKQQNKDVNKINENYQNEHKEIGYEDKNYNFKQDKINLNNREDFYIEIKNSPLQLISQIKGYFYINPMLAISLSLTIFSFIGIPPLIGFFAKQMILSSALTNGYIFMAFIAILTSVISACYYLVLIKQIFFEKSDYITNPQLSNTGIKCNIIHKMNNYSKESIIINEKGIKLSSSLAITISILTLIILFFILSPQECLSVTNMLSLILFNT